MGEGTMTMMRMAVGAAVGVLLAGCVDSGDYHGSPRGGWSQPMAAPARENPSVNNTSGGVKAALIDGCNQRYAGDNRRARECQQGYRHSSDALIDGCQRRYRDNGEKLKACLSQAFE
jgi:hypothetical protein